MSTDPVDPWLTVLLCVRDGDAFLMDALESLAWQTDQGFELIAVDDGSTDSTRDILARHRRVDQLVDGWSMGLGAARNAGLAVAQGRYVTFIDHDDLYHPDRIANLKEITLEYPSIRAFNTSLLSFTTGDNTPEPPFFMELGPGYPEVLVNEKYLREVLRSDKLVDLGRRQGQVIHEYGDSLYWSAAGSTLVVQRELLNAAGGFPTHLMYGEDQVALHNLLRFAPVLEVDEPSYFYRIRHDSMARATGAVWSYAAAMVDLRLGHAERSTKDDGGGRFWTLETLLCEVVSSDPSAQNLMRAVALLRVLYPANRPFGSAVKRVVAEYTRVKLRGSSDAKTTRISRPHRKRNRRDVAESARRDMANGVGD